MKSPLLSPFTVYTRIVISPLLTTPMKFPRSAEEYEFAPFSAKSSTIYVIPSISIISFSAPFMIPIIGVLRVKQKTSEIRTTEISAADTITTFLFDILLPPCKLKLFLFYRKSMNNSTTESEVSAMCCARERIGRAKQAGLVFLLQSQGGRPARAGVNPAGGGAAGRPTGETNGTGPARARAAGRQSAAACCAAEPSAIACCAAPQRQPPPGQRVSNPRVTYRKHAPPRTVRAHIKRPTAAAAESARRASSPRARRHTRR